LGELHLLLENENEEGEDEFGFDNGDEEGDDDDYVVIMTILKL
jgi:hypothetical protein